MRRVTIIVVLGTVLSAIGEFFAGKRQFVQNLSVSSRVTKRAISAIRDLIFTMPI